MSDVSQVFQRVISIKMKSFQKFPWRYLKDVLDSREPWFEISIHFTKEEFGDDAHVCPKCGKQPDDLTWIPVDTADETWRRGEGQSGFVTCCMGCQQQIDFFVDDELTRGGASQDLRWSEAEPVG